MEKEVWPHTSRESRWLHFICILFTCVLSDLALLLRAMPADVRPTLLFEQRQPLRHRGN